MKNTSRNSQKFLSFGSPSPKNREETRFLCLASGSPKSSSKNASTWIKSLYFLFYKLD